MSDKQVLSTLFTCLKALSQCEAYFDDRQDADCDQEGFVPNEEMKLLIEVTVALNTAQSTLRKLEAGQ